MESHRVGCELKFYAWSTRSFFYSKEDYIKITYVLMTTIFTKQYKLGVKVKFTL